ncbi:MAG TPA: AraC family transcriptional regulator [Polyangia bacterium]|nr:AraC family transcriptional regulator [Polyangia bacterium]
MPRVAPGKPIYRRFDHLGLETCVYRGPLPPMPMHAHAQVQLTLYAGGPRRFDIARQSFTGDTCTSVIIQSGEPHGSVAVADEETALRTFYIDEKMMEEAAASIWHRGGTVAFRDPRLMDPSTVARLHAAHRSLQEGGLEGEVAFCAALEQLVARHAAPTGARRNLARNDSRMEQVRDLLVQRVAENVRLDDLAQVADLSRFHLIRLFRQRYGVTPFAFQRNLRVERVRDALRYGESLAEAAADLGFADQSHLGRAFRAVMGATPGQYRQSFLRK